MNVLGGRGGWGGDDGVHNIPPSIQPHTSSCHLEARVTLSGRFTDAASSHAVDDRVLSLSSFIREKNGREQLGADRTEPSISAVIMHKAADISCCRASYCAGTL